MGVHRMVESEQTQSGRDSYRGKPRPSPRPRLSPFRREVTSLDPSQTLCVFVRTCDWEILDRFRSSSSTTDVEDSHCSWYSPVTGTQRIDSAAHGPHIDHALIAVTIIDFRHNSAGGKVDFGELTDDDVVDESGPGDGGGDSPTRSLLVGDVCES